MRTKLKILSVILTLLAAVPAEAVKVHKKSEGLADKKVYFTKSEGLAKCDVDWKGYKKSNAGYLSRSLDLLQFPTDELMRKMVLPGEGSLYGITR